MSRNETNEIELSEQGPEDLPWLHRNGVVGVGEGKTAEGHRPPEIGIARQHRHVIMRGSRLLSIRPRVLSHSIRTIREPHATAYCLTNPCDSLVCGVEGLNGWSESTVFPLVFPGAPSRANENLDIRSRVTSTLQQGFEETRSAVTKRPLNFIN